MSSESVKNFKIANKTVGAGCKPFVIAEVSQTHDGSLGLAHAFIDASAEAGADAVKFQTHIAEAESTPGEPFRVNFSYEDKTRYDYWKRMEFTPEQWQGLAQHAKEKGIIFLSSAFSLEAVTLLDHLEMPAWKIGSGEVNNPLLLQAMTDTKKPILLSTGMSPWSEIEQAVQRIQETSCPIGLFQCTSKYPTSLKEVGLNVLQQFRDQYTFPIGLSDHSGSIFPSLAAMAQGANMIEVHVTFHKKMFGPDVPVSLNFEELKVLCDGANALQTMQENPVDKNQMADSLAEMRRLFNKSVALRRALSAGDKIARADLTTKKPGNGIPATDLEKCVGKQLKTDVGVDRVLTWDDLN
ncbi:MAG: N-acetylneuraminate synthase family protein [Deltaproteobacteria bacterium]|nr:N-acetylneuraminate synthase family protein [Deltaproteobacteria bacterium]